ncbi:zinc ribbon domain-containing protein [Streptomyces sp. NPDC101149]|uniref:zinc ribbon domain-containing protein n=1 Tax=Streptomyces sp. NPDC101149 TaxID=3366113 RepID=UPI0037F13C1F
MVQRARRRRRCMTKIVDSQPDWLHKPLSVVADSVCVIAETSHGGTGPRTLRVPKEVGKSVSTIRLDVMPPFDAAPARRFRGKNRRERWKRGEDSELAVIRLPLDVHRLQDLHRVENLYSAMWSIKCVLQRDARDAVDAYWAGDVRRERDAKAWRQALGLSREGMERRSYRHMERSKHLGHHVTKALVMHQADSVWEGVARHIFPDATGRRFGRPKTGTWWDYTRIPGRARSHTTARKWETFRLHGTLAGHLAVYRHRSLGVEGMTPEQAIMLPPGTSVLEQPRRLPVPARPAGRVPTGEVTAKGTAKTRAATWWDHTGPLAVVFTGGADSQRGDLILPVRLPSGAGRWPRLVHFLNNPDTWHKVDLVRHRDTAAPGGWAYEAHLMVLTGGYASPGTRARRKAAAELGRVGGIDGNVSNLSVVSFPDTFDPADAEIQATRAKLTDTERAAVEKARRKERGRKRALDRSRRATNQSQYGPSKRQHARAERRQQAGLPARQVQVPGGARAAHRAGVPKQAYRRDDLSAGYRLNRARLAEAAATAAAARDHRARRIAERIITDHGANLVVEDCDIRTWYSLWGKALQATTPGRLTAAVGRECEKAGGRMLRASTFTTKLSQTCLCGAEVKKTLADRVHRCTSCGLVADRDMVSAALAAHVRFSNPDDPSTAGLDKVQARMTQILFAEGLQEALSSQPQRGARPRRGRTHAAAQRPIPGPRAPARQNTTDRYRPTPNETRPALERHKGHVGTAAPVGNAPPRGDTPEQELVGRHPTTG